MKLELLLKDLSFYFQDAKGQEIKDGKLIQSLLETEVSSVTNDSRRAGPGSLFFCIEGTVSDGHAYAGRAACAGACAIVVQKDPELGDFQVGAAAGEEKEGAGPLPAIIRVESSRHAMAVMSAAFYGNPAKRMKVIGITGTKGKTTTTYMVRSILEEAGIPTGLVGTIETLYRSPEGEVRIPAANTTPESIVLQRTFRDMADSGMRAVVMEVSSQALMLERTGGFIFDLGIFTNLSPDHVGPNEHRDFEDYLHCKSLLFRQCRTGILNGDDPYCERILEGHTCKVETFGLGSGNDLRAEKIELIHTPGELGIAFDVLKGRKEGRVQEAGQAPSEKRASGEEAGGEFLLRAHVPAPGSFSVYNALCAIAVCRHFGVQAEAVRGALGRIHVKGRIEMVRVSDEFTLLIDYAHNAMALESLLKTLREYEPGRLVCLFGCGGNRARSRRFEMGEVSGRLADLTIITSDNPRDEDPMAIIEDIVTGIRPTGGEFVRIPDRKEAIRYAIENGRPRDIIVLAGKGHEDYQEIRGKKYPMDERVLIREILSESGQSTSGEAKA